MTYVALLRGINVGGNNKVDMKRLKSVFEAAGMESVSTYINSGNVIFQSDMRDTPKLVTLLEQGIEKEFGFAVKVLLRDLPTMQKVVQALPPDWQNNNAMKCDVMFLWEEVCTPDVIKELEIKPEIDSVTYVDGAILWKVDRANVTRSGMMKLVGTKLYKLMTIRNCNTARKLVELMQATATA